MKYPEMRHELIDHLQALSDINYQRDVWSGQYQHPEIEHDELDYAVHFLFDDTCLAENPSKAIGWFLNNEKEAQTVKDLVTALEEVFHIYGTNLDDADYIEKPEWSKVLQAAYNAKIIIV